MARIRINLIEPESLLLCALTALFAFRVFVQLLQFVNPIAILPGFVSWQSGALAYPLLLPIQLALLAAMIWVCYRLTGAKRKPVPTLSRHLAVIGAFYVVVMLGRLIGGQTVFADHFWMDAALPTVFHFVLAAFLLTVAAVLNPDAIWINPLKVWTKRLAYPLLVALGLIVHRYLIEQDNSLFVSTTFPVVLAFCVILLLERLLPARRDWAVSAAEFKTDATYLVLVQMLLPKLLLEQLALVLALAGAFFVVSHGGDIAVASASWPGLVWPHDWAVPAQAMLVLLIADFFRYWLHRASHSVPLLWRFHAIHHAPKGLHASNVGRFHPLEKFCQFLFDTVPFVLLGVAPEVLAFYFVFYAINGYLQHCNIDLRLGVLNNLVAGPQLHRWHHSRDAEQAHCNFGNNTIIWDLIFSTANFRLQPPAELGLHNQHMPDGIIAQTLSPFNTRTATRDTSPSDVKERGWSKMYSRIATAVLLRGAWLIYAWPILRAARRPARAQKLTLARILKANTDSRFGKLNGFSQITSQREFASRVPIMHEAELAKWLSSDPGSRQALTVEPPAMYARTSGTTARPKDIPMTPTMLRRLRSQQCAALAFQYARCPSAFGGDLLAITSPASEGTAADGRSFGSASGHLVASTPKLLRDKAVLPPSVLAVEDPKLKYLLILRLALMRPNITFMGTANPSTLLLLLSLLREHADALINDVATGGFHRQQQLSDDLKAELNERLRPDPARAAAIRKIVESTDELSYKALWPGIKMLVCWTAAGGGIAMRALRQELPAQTIVLDLGYIASEFRGTVTTASDRGLALLNDVFYEFVEKSAWESGQRQTVLIHELSPQKQYYVIATTQSGLYRYFMNDIVRVSGQVGQTPTFEFVQKGRGVTNITGEKLYEGQFLDALSTLNDEFNLDPVYALLQADRHKARYTLYLEAHRSNTVVRVFQLEKLAKRLDQLLAERNLEYRARRLSGRLKPLLFRYLSPGTSRLVRAVQVKRGQREGQLKLPALAYREDLPVALADHEWGATT